MEMKSETKSLPRNRKCGNCRYFEPAPLWRKGWCRNPRLYDRRANHLVDATTIDCEQVFRARIYWEPKLQGEIDTQQEAANSGTKPASFSADSGGRAPQVPTDNILRPSGGNKPVIVRREVAPDRRFIKKQSRSRKWLLDNIPYYDKIDGPLHSINYRVLLPWLIVVILLGFILFNLTSNKTKDVKTISSNPTETSAVVTLEPTLAAAINSNPGLTTPVVSTNVAPTTAPANSKTPLATATLSGAIPTAVAPSPTPAAVKVQAKVQAPKGLHLRQTACTVDANPDCKTLATIPDGAIIQITGNFVLGENIQWWPVTYNGLNGFVAKDFLQQISP